MLFVLWAMLTIAALFGAGYSHYRYRVRNNRYYKHLFAKESPAEACEKAEPPTYSPYAFPVFMLMVACLLVPISLAI